MNAKRIALTVFLIGLILLAAGFVLFFIQGENRSKNLQTNVLKNPKAGEAAVNNQPVQPNPAAPQTFTDQQINQQIDIMKQQLSQKPKSRPYTDAELFFLSQPKAAAMQALKGVK